MNAPAAVRQSQLHRTFFALLLFCAPIALQADEVHFIRQIQPILADHCFTCHGPDEAERQADLRLDIPAEAVRELDSGVAAIVPGKPADSELVRRILSTDEFQVMPPADADARLTQQEKDLLVAWIRQGAGYQKHWAYVAPQRPELPTVTNGSWVRTPIDEFILASIEQQELRVSAPADRYTLIRRLSLTLTGLPPTIEEVDAFVTNEDPKAYERLVDRLMKESSYGEHMARQWLDVARYADSNGYHVDTTRHIWAWRDWVISAFNENMPFDQFTVEQLAGDLLPGATDSQIIATGFHRNTMFNEEGGIDPEEFRTKAVKDRVSTTMTAWMGATMMCCECHDHKYDPLTQKEFYQLYAFFNNVPETGGGFTTKPKPFFDLPQTADQQKNIHSLERQLAAATKTRDDAKNCLKESAAKWEREFKAGPDPVVWTVLDPLTLTSSGGAELKKLDDFSVKSGGTRPDSDITTFVADTDLSKITAVKLELLPDPDFPAAGSGRFEGGLSVLTMLSATTAPRSDPAAEQPVAFIAAVADYSQSGFEVEGAIDESKIGWAVHGQTGQRHHAILTISDPTERAGETRIAFQLYQTIGLGHVLGRYRISVTNVPGPFTADQPAVTSTIQPILGKPTDQRSAAEATQLLAYYEHEVKADLTDFVNRLTAAHDTAKTKRQTTMVMTEMDEPRDAFIQTGGSFLVPGDAVQAAVPAVFHPLHVEGDKTPGRLELAQWLTDPQNPLIARVTVNRLWQQVFGSGLVGSPEEFGTRGELPTHPELLDWLATEFVRTGWDMKSMLRLMVTSTTFRQSSEVTPATLEHDPENRFLARGPRHRLDGETIRDSALAISGLLNRQIGGPSVYPYQTGNLWLERGLGEWPTSKGDALYRRSMYTFWRRAVPHPYFAVFDAPSREFCVVKRPRTNTPLQALATLNSKHFAEASRVFADRILKQSLSNDFDRIAFAFRSCVARPPQERESQQLLKLLNDRKQYFRQNGDEAAKVPGIGEAPDATGGTPEDVAAWTVVANVLLNLDETLTRL